jgi:ATP-dependent protease HslVU (ClpYQ) peptidase subunit
MKTLIERIKENLESNNGKISYDFIQNLAENADIKYLHPTSRTRLCIMTLDSGHDIVGKAQVLDPNNDVEEIGNEIAFENAREQIWAVCGNIALALK